jgi:hypothetical protein
MLLGRSIWFRDGASWGRESFDESGVHTAPAIARLSEILARRCRERTVLVFEPEGIAHQTVETPRVGRKLFASLARVRSEYPVVYSESLGWGIEHPEPAHGGSYSTLMHYELTPGLVHLRDACAQAGSQLHAAWSAYTAAAATYLEKTEATPRASFALILVPGFAAVAARAGGRRAFRSWSGAMAERDWRALSAFIGDFEARPPASMPEAERRGGSITALAEGKPGRVCPIWEELHAKRRLESVVGIETLLEGAARLSRGHPGNLVGGFPRPVQLDKVLACTAAGCLSVAAALGSNVPSQLAHLKSAGQSGSFREAALESHIMLLDRNRREMATLQSELANAPGRTPPPRHEILLGLAAAVPDALTVTSLKIGRDDRFAMDAMIVGADFDPQAARRALERNGFAPEGQNGWILSLSSGELTVRGRYTEPQP